MVANSGRLVTLTPFIFAIGVATSVQALEISGSIFHEARVFPDSPADTRQFDGNNISLAFEPELYQEWRGGNDSVTFTPFMRLDENDEERTHFDIRELSWLHVADQWELRAGISKVFWGVTESQHLVDIINQNDGVENLDGEDKLGQPMINLALIRDWGTLDFFVLPGFRERTFAGIEGRQRTLPVVDVDNPQYQSDDEEHHIDYAFRWSHTLGDWDIGLSQFRGTGREPRLIPNFVNGELVSLIPRYEIIDQTGIDVQATKGNWLWKLEAIHRSQPVDSFNAIAAGFEYTFFSAFESAADIGVIAEYLYDDRDKQSASPFDNDLFVGARLALNDTQSSELLTGIIVDLDSHSSFFNLEAVRRLGDSWKLSVEWRSTAGLSSEDAFFSFRNDDILQLELGYYF